MLRAFSSDFDGQSGITLDEPESRHISCVLRAREGASIEVLNGRGMIGRGSVVLPDKKATKINFTEILVKSPAEPGITLLHASLTNNNTEFVIREATAIGVKNIWIFQSTYSESKIKNKLEAKNNHLRKVIIEACKQSGNPHLPDLYFAPDLYGIKFSQKESDLRLFGNISPSSRPLLGHLKMLGAAKNIIIAIGPEGDFSEQEKKFLFAQGFMDCSLGRHILRAETATIYALSVINNYLETEHAK